MNSRFATTLLSTLTLGAATPQALAAPAVQSVAKEWSIRLENDQGLILVDQASGQVRLLDLTDPKRPLPLGPFVSSVNQVDHLGGGFLDSSDTEWFTLSSSVGNASILFRVHSGQFEERNLPLVHPGPTGQIPLQQPDAEQALALSTARYAGGGHGFGQIINLFENPKIVGGDDGLDPLSSLQSHRSDQERLGFVLAGDPNSEQSLIQLRTEDGESLKSERLIEISALGILTTEVRGEDGRICILIHRPDSKVVEIMTLDENGFSESLKETTFENFAIGSISPVPAMAAGEDHGVWITAADGSSAVHAIVREGAVLEILSTIEPEAGQRFTAAHSSAAAGLIMLRSSGSGFTDSFERRLWNGSEWALEGAGSLPTTLGSSASFPTLFWFDGEPSVSPTAEIIKMEIEPEWTIPPNNLPIPASVQLAALSNSATGLSPSGSQSLTAPSGATHVLTNQVASDVSLSALDSLVALSRPALNISPSSGTFRDAVEVEPLFDEDANQVFYRRDLPGELWRPFTSLTVAYPSTWLFYARNIETGVSGPIISRSYLFTGTDLNSVDSDRDGVPDYVELARGLDPTAGADSDGDFQSDLEELLAGTSPTDSNSLTTPDSSRTPPFIGEGFSFVAQAFGPPSQPGSADPAEVSRPDALDITVPPEEKRIIVTGGTSLRVHSMTGGLLGEGLVETYDAQRRSEVNIPSSYLNQTGALLTINSPIPEFEWITASTPTFWAYESATDETQAGRETLRVLTRPINIRPTITHTPGGTNLNSDAASWITAARAAYLNHEPFSGITRLDPVDNVIAVLAEAAIFRGLDELVDKVTLGVPASAADFTLFPFRGSQAGLTPLSTPMKQALVRSGFSLTEVINEIDAVVRATPVLVQLASDLHHEHFDKSETNPLMPLPFDALRSLLYQGTLTDPNGNGRPNPYQDLITPALNQARSEMDAIAAATDGLRRPIATWTVVVEDTTDPSQDYQFRISTSDSASDIGQLAWPVDRFGDRIALDQGLGLAIGTELSIRGFTDVTAPAGHLGIEVTSLISTTVITPSSRDTDGDLLDDEWEELFFGDLAAVSVLDNHPITGHSYLEYQMSGENPRAGTLTTEPIILRPQRITGTWLPAENAYDIEFDFPAEFVGEFVFTLDSTTNLQGYNPNAQDGSLREITAGRYALRTLAADSDLDAAFWRIRMTLPD